VAWLLAGRGISIAGVWSAHTSQSVLWIIDLAPIVLGVAGSLIGVEYANVDAAWRAADKKVKEQTTGLREANGQLESLNRSKGEFAATISHEVKTPLTVALGLADEMQAEPSARGDADLAELAELVGDQGREITNIIEDLLVAARDDVETMAVVPELIDLGVTVLTGGTDTPVLLVDLRPMSLTGVAVSDVLESAGLTANKNGLPDDPESPKVPPGLRLGSTHPRLRLRPASLHPTPLTRYRHPDRWRTQH
jgi:signal transduction histidine kinase